MTTEEIAALFWEDVFGETIDIAHLAKLIKLNLGHDGATVSNEDIKNALHSADNVVWRDIGWACREAFLGFDPVKEESGKQFIVYVAMTCLWAEAVARKRLEWDSSFDHLLRFAYSNLSIGSSTSRVRWFAFLFRDVAS